MIYVKQFIKKMKSIKNIVLKELGGYSVDVFHSYYHIRLDHLLDRIHHSKTWEEHSEFRSKYFSYQDLLYELGFNFTKQ